jgi:hypothetical protein
VLFGALCPISNELLPKPVFGSLSSERIYGSIVGENGMISFEQARVHWIKKTLESGEITIENPHSRTQVGLALSPSNPCNRVSTILLNVILLCIFHITTLPQSHLVNSPEADMERRPEDRAVEEGVKEVLALSQAHRPKNTRRCYLPKQKEWKASLFPSTLLLFCHFISYPFLYRSIANLRCLQGWCKRMAFRPGGELRLGR